VKAGGIETAMTWLEEIEVKLMVTMPREYG